MYNSAVKRMFGKRFVAVLVVCLMAAGASPQNKKPASAAPKAAPAVKAPASPLPAAEKVRLVLQDYLEQWERRNAGKNPPEKVVRLTEGEVNAYLKEEVRAKSPKYPGLQAIVVKFISLDYVGVTTTIDFSKVRQLDSNIALRSVRYLLTGSQQIYVEGSVSSANRMGQFKLEKAYLGNVRLPVTLIEFLIKHFAPPQDPPIELGKPAVLPYGLKRIAIEPGSVTLRG
jgi:hypothetical protein